MGACYQAVTLMKLATCHSWIGWCIGSKRRFVFRASHIYKAPLSSFISNIFSKKSLSEQSRQPCQDTLSESYPVGYFTRQPLFALSGKCFILVFHNHHHCYFYVTLCLHFCQTYTPVEHIRPVSLRFYHQFVGNV